MRAEKAGFAVTEMKPLIGTEIRADADTLLSGKYAKDIRALLEERAVLVFPQVDLNDEQQIAFTKTLGTLATEYDGQADQTGSKQFIFKVSLDKNETRAANSLKGTVYWHFDGSTHDVPILGALLSARRLPAEGSATEWCSTSAAYDALSQSEKKEIEHLRVVCSDWARQLHLNPQPSYDQLKAWMSYPSREHPLVWTHRNGRKSLILGSTVGCVVGKPYLESLELLVRLRDWATQPQFVYRHDWTLGDMVLWDNTGALHRAVPYAEDSGRLLHRTMLQGEEPVA
jgi:alpha-ketoglutarate-dependent taurine dioxygenase